MAENATSEERPVTSTSAPARPPLPQEVPAPWAIRIAVLFDWAVAFLMAGLAVGHLGHESPSDADFALLALPFPLLLVIGEGLRHGGRRAWILHVVASSLLAVPGGSGVLLAVRGKAVAGDVDPVLGALVTVGLLALAQLPLAAGRAARTWVNAASASRPRRWALLMPAMPVVVVGLALQLVAISREWRTRSYPEVGIELRMPRFPRASVHQARTHHGLPYGVHAVDADEHGCAYVVTYLTMPSSADGGPTDGERIRSAAVARVTSSAEITSRRPVVSKGPKGAVGPEGEEIRFDSDGRPWTARIFAPLPRLVVMQAFCMDGSEPRGARTFFESLTVLPNWHAPAGSGRAPRNGGHGAGLGKLL
jgi:hypothetical protein